MDGWSAYCGPDFASKNNCLIDSIQAGGGNPITYQQSIGGTLKGSKVFGSQFSMQQGNSPYEWKITKLGKASSMLEVGKKICEIMQKNNCSISIMEQNIFFTENCPTNKTADCTDTELCIGGCIDGFSVGGQPINIEPDLVNADGSSDLDQIGTQMYKDSNGDLLCEANECINFTNLQYYNNTKPEGQKYVLDPNGYFCSDPIKINGDPSTEYKCLPKFSTPNYTGTGMQICDYTGVMGFPNINDNVQIINNGNGNDPNLNVPAKQILLNSEQYGANWETNILWDPKNANGTFCPWIGYNYIKNGNIKDKISTAKFTYNIDTTDNNDYWCFSDSGAPLPGPEPPPNNCIGDPLDDSDTCDKYKNDASKCTNSYEINSDGTNNQCYHQEQGPLCTTDKKCIVAGPLP